MYYGYVGKQRTTEKVYVITEGYETPEEAENARDDKIAALPKPVYAANYFLSRGVLRCTEPIEIPEGYWGVSA